MHVYDREGEVKPQGPVGVGESRVGMGEVGQWRGGEQGGNGRGGPVGGQAGHGRSSKFFMYKSENYFI